MSRPVRIGFPNALYHVIARGDWREDTFEDDADRHAFLDIFAQVVEQFNSLCYAWCLMDIHYHLLIQTADANLSKGMRQLNGVYTQTSNRRRASMGLAPGHPFLAVDGLLAQFAKRRTVAQSRYAKFVTEGIKAPLPWKDLKGQVFPGDERFVEKMQARMDKQRRIDVQIPIAHRRAPPPTLSQIEQRSPDRNTAIVKAHATGAYSYQQIA